MKTEIVKYGFGGREKSVIVDVLPGETLEKVASRCFPDFLPTHFAVNGKLTRGDTLATGGTVAVWSVPRGGTVGGFLVSLAISVILSAASYFVQKQQMKKAMRTNYAKDSESLSTTQYGWDYDAKNAVTEGAPVPVLYGRRMVIPPIAQQHTYADNISGDSFLEMTYTVADGGAGFSDVITYPMKDGNFQALIDHTPWQNFNTNPEEETGSDNYLLNRGNIYSGANFNTTDGSISGTIEPRLNDGDLTKPVEFGSQSGFQGFVLGGNGVTPTSFRIYSRYGNTGGSKRYSGVRGFKVDAFNFSTNQWDFLGETSAYYAVSENVACSELRVYFPNTMKWRMFKIYDKKFFGDGTKNITEIEMGVDLTSSSGLADGNIVKLECTQGNFYQDAFSISNGTWASLSVQKKLDSAYFVFSTSPKAYPDNLTLQLEFPYGLYGVDSTTGDTINKQVQIHAQYRGVNANGTTGSWTDFFDNSHATSEISISGGVATITKNTQTELNLSFVRTELNDGGYDHFDFQVKFETAPIVETGEMADCVWNGLDEGWNFIPKYIRTAAANLKMEASDRISGAAPQFRILAERSTVYVYNTINSQWEERPASNPAWAAYDLIVRPRFNCAQMDATEGESTGQPNYRSPNDAGALMRETFDHRKMLFGEFQAWADFCDANGITCSMYFDSQITVSKALSYICDIGRAAIIMRGGSIGVSVEKRAMLDQSGNPVPVFIFNEQNIVADTFGVQWRDMEELPTEIEVTFFDKDRDWNRFTVVARTPDADVEGVTPKVDSVTLYACDSRALAEAHAEYLLKQNLISKTFAWTGIIDSLPVDIGDVVEVNGNLVTVTSVTINDDYTKKYEGVEYVDARFAP